MGIGEKVGRLEEGEMKVRRRELQKNSYKQKKIGKVVRTERKERERRTILECK